MADVRGARPLTVVIWMLVVATLLIGIWKVMHLDSGTHDRTILIEKSKSH